MFWTKGNSSVFCNFVHANNPFSAFYKVLTSHSCSEEGLEDAANILLQLSRGDGATRDTVLRLLLSGARHLGYTLCKQIGRCLTTTQMLIFAIIGALITTLETRCLCLCNQMKLGPTGPRLKNYVLFTQHKCLKRWNNVRTFRTDVALNCNFTG